MNCSKKTYTIFQKASAVFMILTLFWLTISTPFVFACQQELAKQGKISHAQPPDTSNEEETAKPPANSPEEKVPSPNNSFSEEYLHENHQAHCFFFEDTPYHKSENDGTYTAYHGELLVPPPDAV